MYKKERKDEIEQIKRENRKRISKNFKYLRLSLGMTQDEFAKAIGSSKSYLSRIENESRSAGGDILARIQDYFGKKPEYFHAPREEGGEVKRGIKILVTSPELADSLRPGMRLFISKNKMTRKGAFIVGWDFEGEHTITEYKKWMPVEVDPEAPKKAVAQIKIASLSLV